MMLPGRREAPVVHRSIYLASVTLAAIVLSQLTGCQPEEETTSAVAYIMPKKIWEACYDLPVGRQIHYRFTASEALRFNIHYHREKDVVYGIEEFLTSEGSGTHAPETSARHCLMWTNPNERKATVRYEYKITCRTS